MNIKCRGTRHVWHVRNDGDKLDSAGLKAGHVCACGEMEIYRRRCECGSSHKRVDTVEKVKNYRHPSP